MMLDGFKFRENPFGISPDPRFIYLDAARQGILSKLISGILSAKSVFLITGDPGVGKTILLNHLAAELETACRLSVLIFSGVWDPTLHEVLDGVGGNKDKAVLLINGAEDLTPAVLERLASLPLLERDRRQMSVVLAGAPKIASTRNGPESEAKHRPFDLIVQLKPFQEGDVRAYIQHRLRVAGCAGFEPFTPEAIDRIAEYSGGYPRGINRICRSALATAARRGSKFVSGEIIEEVSLNDRMDTPSNRILASERSSKGVPDRSGSNLKSPLQPTDALSDAPAAMPLGANKPDSSDGVEAPTSTGAARRLAVTKVGAQAPSPGEVRFSADLGSEGLDRLDLGYRPRSGKRKRVMAIAIAATLAICAIASAAVFQRFQSEPTVKSVPAELNARSENTRSSEEIAGVASLLARKTEPSQENRPSAIKPDVSDSPETAGPGVAPVPPAEHNPSAPQGGPAGMPPQGPSAEPRRAALDTGKESSLDPIELDRLLARGDELWRLKDVASARLFYRLAATKGSAHAAVLLAQTYDPIELLKVGIVDVRPAPGEAVAWYRKAVSMGDPDAKGRLNALIARLQSAASQGDAEAKRIVEQAP